MDQATLRFVIQLGIIGFTFFMLINASALLVLAERKIMGFMQQRYGPYLVGPHGILQPLADILKLLFKEELRPKDADKWLFTLAPMISVTAAFAAFAAVPWGAETTFFGLLDTPVKLGVSDINVGVLVVFAITSMGVYGIVLAGWASNSKYSLFGVANNIVGKTLCAFGDAAATPVLSTMKLFRHEYEAHVREGRCTLPAEWRAKAPVFAGAH